MVAISAWDVRCSGVVSLALLLAACGPVPLPPGQPETTDESSLGNESESDGETSHDTGEQPPCDAVGYSECRSPLDQEWLDCRAACPEPMLSCSDEVCEAACHVQYDTESWAVCKEAYCPGPINDYQLCVHTCELQALACAADDCEPHTCSYGLYQCIWENCGCAVLKLDVVWANSCEFQFPGPLYFPSYSQIIIGDQLYWIGPSNLSCDDPDVAAVFTGLQPEPDGLIMCADTCQAFAEVGLARIEIGVPPCE
jgi:hypothetical protein